MYSFVAFTSLLFTFALTTFTAPPPAFAQPASVKGTVYLAEVRGTINPATSQYLKRAIDEASQAKATFLLVELDTPGGLVSSTREIAQSIDRSTIPIVFYVGPAGASATSAGALLMIASHFSAMAPGTNIGAAHPVAGQGQNIEGASAEKAVNDVAAFARGMAELRGRDPKIASEVVSKSSSYSAEEALKNRLINAIAPTRAELFKTLDGKTIKVGREEVKIEIKSDAPVKVVEMHPGESLLDRLAHPNIAAILMTIGILLIYAEISSPGFGVAGIAGALCLLIAFIAFQALPIRIGGLALMGLGAALLVAEIFLASGGLLAVGGIISFFLGLLWVVDPAATDLRISTWVWVLSVSTLSLGALAIGWAGARTMSLNRKALQEVGGGGLEGLQGYLALVQVVNSDGRSGKVSVRGELWSFTCDSDVKIGDKVNVTEVSGLKLRVSRS